jgi:hypothetical protein
LKRILGGARSVTGGRIGGISSHAGSFSKRNQESVAFLSPSSGHCGLSPGLKRRSSSASNDSTASSSSNYGGKLSGVFDVENLLKRKEMMEKKVKDFQYQVDLELSYRTNIDYKLQVARQQRVYDMKILNEIADECSKLGVLNEDISKVKFLLDARKRKTMAGLGICKDNVKGKKDAYKDSL